MKVKMSPETFNAQVNDLLNSSDFPMVCGLKNAYGFNPRDIIDW
jgi:hypothetical protein